METVKHFELTATKKVNAFGVTLFQIKAVVSFGLIKKGDLGGWVEKESNLSGNAQVSGNAWVSGNAQVYGDAQVYGNAQVYGYARVSGYAWVSGDAQVSGDARVYGDAQVSGDARVYGYAWVSGDAWDKSPFQVQGTKHFVNVCKKGSLKIGCIELTYKEWEKQYKEIGKHEGYTPTQIKEYGLYIKLAIELSKL